MRQLSVQLIQVAHSFKRIHKEAVSMVLGIIIKTQTHPFV